MLSLALGTQRWGPCAAGTRMEVHCWEPVGCRKPLRDVPVQWLKVCLCFSHAGCTHGTGTGEGRVAWPIGGEPAGYADTQQVLASGPCYA